MHSKLDVGDHINIDGEEAGHILQSRRLSVGDSLMLTNGQGFCARAAISSVDKKKKVLQVLIDTVEYVARPKVSVALASAIAKGERQSVLINMATQLGMNQFIPLHCDHSVTQASSNAVKRWQRIAMSACKQSRQFHFPEILTALSLDQLIDQYASEWTLVVADMGGGSIDQLKRPLNQSAGLLLVVGPEGGLSEREQKLLQSSKVLKLSLASPVLRTETACVAMLAAVNQILNLLHISNGNC